MTKVDNAFEAAAARATAEDKVIATVTKPTPKPTPKPIPITIKTASAKLIKNVWPLQRDAITFYGDPFNPDFLANLTHVTCPWKFTTGHDLIISHKKCADSLMRVLNKTWDDIGHSQDHAHTLGYDVFDGSYVVRPMRGGKLPSMHSFGCAFDFDAAQNQQHSMKHLFQRNTPLVDNFLNEGWVWGGDWSVASIDAMHFQAARVHA